MKFTEDFLSGLGQIEEKLEVTEKTEKPLLSKEPSKEQVAVPRSTQNSILKENLARVTGDYNFNQKPSDLKEYGFAREYMAGAFKDDPITIKETLCEAISDRMDGLRSVSMREADILTRQGMNSSSEFLILTLKYFDSFINEGPIEIRDNVYELRARYNHGIQWLKANQAKASETLLESAKARLASIIEMLTQRKYPLYPHEVEFGFAKELLKPEHMTWDKFGRDSSQPKAGIDNQVSKVK